MKQFGTAIGSLVFFAAAPGTVAGWVPYWLTRCGMQRPFLGVGQGVLGVVLVVAGLAAILAMLLGQSLILGSALLLQYAVVVWLFFHTFVLVYEEPMLMAQFGPSYGAYRENVGRWWPRIHPWRGGGQGVIGP
jgi:hypothetical protein